jgi:C4-dicarboxylate-specific signal transduction histidine kinase
VILELTIKGRQGRPLEVRLESVAGLKSAPMTCQTAMIDITEHRRAAQEIRLLQAQLAHVARCNTMGELASSLAHELNQPLGAIVLYCDTCLRMTRAGVKDPNDLGAALEQVSDAARHASAIIRHLRAFLRKGDGQRTEVDLNTLIREVVKLLEMETRDCGGTIHLNLVPDLPRVIADPIQIEQVLVNLARNGIEAMERDWHRNGRAWRYHYL